MAPPGPPTKSAPASRGCYIIDVACPFDTRMKTKELEKAERYQDLRREISRIWECRNVCVVPIVIGRWVH